MSLEEVIASAVRVAVREEVPRAMREALAEARPKEPSAFLSIQKAANIADVHPETVRRWVSKGLLPDHRATPTGHTRIRRDELEALLAAKPKEKGDQDIEEMADAILQKGAR